MEKTLFDIEKQSWSKVRETYFKLLELAQNNNWLVSRMNIDTVWNNLEKICVFLNSVGNDNEMSYQEKHTLFSIGTEEMSEFIKKINILKEKFVVDSNQKTSFDDFILICEEKIYGQKDNNQSFFQILTDVKLLEVKLENQFEIILYVLGQRQFITPYSVDEFIGFFVNIEQAEAGRFITTLIHAKLDEKDIYPLIEFIFESILGDEDTLDTQDVEIWFNWLVIYYALDLVWFHFSRLSDLQKDYLLKNYFYRSIVMGLPIEKFISDYLSESLDIIEFFSRHKVIQDSLNNNQESVLTDLNKNSFELFTDLLNKYIALNKDNYLDGYKMNDFLNNVYGSYTGREPFINWLRKGFALYFSIKEAMLVDWDELVVSDPVIYNYEKEMSKAVFCFVFGGNFLNKIVDFLQNKSFGLSALVRTIKSIVDLTNEKDIERIMNLNSVLKQNNLLSSDEDLVHFDEQKNEFVWSDQLV